MEQSTELAHVGAEPRFPHARPLPRLVRHRSEETARSILVRIALANGMRNVRHLFKASPGVLVQHVVGREARVELASKLSGFDAAEISANTPIVMTGSHISVAGFVFNRHYGKPGRLCPACVEEDLERFADEREDLRAFRRGWWQLPSITTCPRHRVTMVSRCGTCSAPLDQDRQVRSCSCGHADIRGEEVAADACDHDPWLIGRVGLGPVVEHPLLDAMHPDRASELCRFLGLSMEGEMVRGARHYEPLALAEARSRGWSVLRDGEPGLLRALDKLADRGRGFGTVCNTGYGSLNRFLTHYDAPDLDRIRAMVAEHASSNVALHGATLFGRAVTGAVKISTGQAARLLKVSESFVRNILSATDAQAAPLAAGPVLLDGAQFLRVKEVLRTTMRTPEAADALGFDVPMMRTAVEEGLLEIVVPTSKSSFGLVGRASVAKLMRCFGVSLTRRDDLLDCKALARLAKVSLADVMISVARGHITPAGRIEDEPGLLGLRFQTEDASFDFHLQLHRRALKERVCAELGWRVDTVPKLIKVGALKADFLFIEIDELARFREQYASSSEAAEWLVDPPAHVRTLNRLLRERCGAPVVSGVGMTLFWKRSVLARGLGQLMSPDAKIYAIGFGSRHWIRNRFSWTRNRRRSSTQNCRFLQ